MTLISDHTIAAVSGLLMLSIACGKPASDSPPPSAGTPTTAAAAPTTAAAAPDPCSLLTLPEASGLLGGPAEVHVGKTTSEDLGVTEKTCEWKLITSDQLGHDLWIGVYGAADRNYFSQHTHGPAIPGLGDAAAGDQREVFVFSKGTMLQTYGSLPVDNGVQQAARFAIAKL